MQWTSSSDGAREIVGKLAGPYSSTRTESNSRTLKKIGECGVVHMTGDTILYF